MTEVCDDDGLNAAAGTLFAVRRPGCWSQRVCVLHCFVGLAGVAVLVLSAVFGTAFGCGVRAGRIDEVGCFGNGDGTVACAATEGRIGGGIPGGGPGLITGWTGGNGC